jgi:hypothetical protein
MLKKQKNQNDLLEEINDKLNTLIGLIASQGRERDEKIRILASIGFTNIEISKLCGIPKGTVDVIRSKIKR